MDKQQFKNLITDTVESFTFDDKIIYFEKNRLKELFTLLKPYPINNPKAYFKKLVLFVFDNAKVSHYAQFDYKQDNTELEILKKYRFSINLNPIRKEIMYRFGENGKGYALNWHNPNGRGMDQIAMELSSFGIFIEAINPADQFFEFLELYKNLSLKPQIIGKPIRVEISKEQAKEYFEHMKKSLFENKTKKQTSTFNFEGL